MAFQKKEQNLWIPSLFQRWGLSVLIKRNCYSYKLLFGVKFNPLWWALSWIYLSYIVCMFYFNWKIVSELFHTWVQGLRWIYAAIWKGSLWFFFFFFWKGSLWISTGVSYVEKCDSISYHTLELSEGEENCSKYIMKLVWANPQLAYHHEDGYIKEIKLF